MVASSTTTSGKDKDESHEDDEDDSIFASSKKGSSVPKVNILGTDIKLDSLSLISLALGGLAALGTGYLIYDQFNSRKKQEEQIKQQENQRQAEYLRYLQAQQEEQRRRELEEQTNLIEKEKSKLTPEQEAEQREIEKYENSGHIDMNLLPQQNYQSSQPLSYEQLLTRHNDDIGYYPKQVSSLAPGYQPKSQQQSDSLIDMDRLLQDPNMEVTMPVQQPIQSQKQRKRAVLQQQEEEDEQEDQQQYPAPLPYRGPTPAELYASMNNNSPY